MSSGNYSEQLSINKPLELVGDEGEEPTIHCRGPCLTVFGDHDTVFAHLRVRTRTVARGNMREPPAVLLSGGCPHFFKCEITSMIVGGLSCPIVEHCLISGNVNGVGFVRQRQRQRPIHEE